MAHGEYKGTWNGRIRNGTLHGLKLYVWYIDSTMVYGMESEFKKIYGRHGNGKQDDH